MYKRMKMNKDLLSILVPELGPERERTNSFSLSTTVQSVQAKIQKFKREKLDPWFVDQRKQQLKELSASLDEHKIIEVEHEVNRNFTIAVASLGFSILGELIYPPATLISALGISWITYVNGVDAYRSLKKGNGIGIDLLAVLFFSGTMLTGNYFAGAVAAVFGRLGKKLLTKTEDYSRKSFITIFSNQRQFVWLLKDGIELETPIHAINCGDTFVVYTGELIPLDGTIISGTASIDQRILTGEAQSVEKAAGDQVFASTVVLSGTIQVCVEKKGQETVAAQIGQILNQTTDFKDEIEAWGDKIANRSARYTMVLSAVTLPFLGPAAAVTILNSVVGLYMRVLGPLSMLTYLNLTSKNGILIKDGRSLQLLTQIDTIVFDKTGTLTLEQPQITRLYPCHGMNENDLLRYGASAEYKQTHPMARAILQAAHERGLNLIRVEDTKYEVGYGVQVCLPSNASIPKAMIRIGSARFMAMENIFIPPEIQVIHQNGHQDGYSYVYVALDEQLCGVIELQATIRPEVKKVIQTLKKRNISLYIISGDHEQPTRKLAQEVGIEHYFAETLPEKKADLIGLLQSEGRSVCFVGDGINDAIALKKANVSISLRGASTVATDTAQIVLMDQNLNQLIQCLDLAQSFYVNMKINVALTCLPGLIGIGGVFFLKFGIIHSVILNNIGLAVGTSNTLIPLLQHQKKR